MPKSTFFTGQPIFTQLLSLIPRSMIYQLSRDYQCDRYCKKFRSFDHLTSMLFSTFHQCTSLRELITGLQANMHKLQHMGLSYTPRRSTLADANARRPAEFFSAVYHHLYKIHHPGSPDSSLSKKSINKRLFIVDSTTITLFSSVMAGMGSYGNNGRKKGGAKAHVLFNARDQSPCFIDLTEGKENDKIFLPKLSLPKGSIVVMDRGYNSYKQLAKWTNQKVMWVTRLHPRSVYNHKKLLPVTDEQRKAGIVKDELIVLGNPKTTHINKLQTVRLIQFTDAESKTEFQFISNNLTINSLTIANIYKRRWDIELFFKRVKQNFNIQYFLGDNENAIKIQIWCGFIADLLVKIIKDKVNKARVQPWSFSNIAGLIRLHLTTYINIYKFLIHPDKALLHYSKHHINLQLSLYT